MTVKSATNTAADSMRTACHQLFGADLAVQDISDVIATLDDLALRKRDFIATLETTLRRLENEASVEVDMKNIGTARELIIASSDYLKEAHADIDSALSNLTKAKEITSHLYQNNHSL